YDSVVLMRVASQLKKQEGVSEVALFMGTQGNHELLEQVGLATPESKVAAPEDLIIIVRAESVERAEAIGTEAVQMLSSRRETSQQTQEYKPRTLERALDYLPQASLAAISIPGEYAAREAARCLDRNLNVFLFSDNVSLQDELNLKMKAVGKGLLCMGPDCGTAFLNGVGLGFTNRLRRGRVGCVAASGTGLQAVMCRIDQLNEGVSHAIGVGGRDLSEEVGGIMSRYALQLLDEDPSTEIIILLSKPPHPDVRERLNETIKKLRTPVITYFQGEMTSSEGADQAQTLDGVAEMAVCLLRNEPYKATLFEHSGHVKDLIERMGTGTISKRIMGLYTGGTLAKEAQLLIQQLAGGVSGNINEKHRHIVIDLGEDRYTVGKPHPMIAPENRTVELVGLAASGNFENCGVLLFDLVLGNGSHLDPAAELISSLELLKEKYTLSIPTVVAVIGTEKDPQLINKQIKILEEYGVAVFLKNSEAARFSAALVEPAFRASISEVSDEH
ncbi:MAG: acyl-CoA synthetase FdrA, partial [bacterium]